MTAYRSNGGTLVPLKDVRIDAAWQPPLHLQDAKVKSFVDLMQKGGEFDPVMVSENGDGSYRVLDGHHRFVASQRCSFTHIPVDIAPKAQRSDAKGHSLRFERVMASPVSGLHPVPQTPS